MDSGTAMHREEMAAPAVAARTPASEGLEHVRRQGPTRGPALRHQMVPPQADCWIRMGDWQYWLVRRCSGLSVGL